MSLLNPKVTRPMLNSFPRWCWLLGLVAACSPSFSLARRIPADTRVSPAQKPGAVGTGQERTFYGGGFRQMQYLCDSPLEPEEGRAVPRMRFITYATGMQEDRRSGVPNERPDIGGALLLYEFGQPDPLKSMVVPFSLTSQGPEDYYFSARDRPSWRMLELSEGLFAACIDRANAVLHVYAFPSGKERAVLPNVSAIFDTREMKGQGELLVASAGALHVVYLQENGSLQSRVAALPQVSGIAAASWIQNGPSALPTKAVAVGWTHDRLTLATLHGSDSEPRLIDLQYGHAPKLGRAVRCVARAHGKRILVAVSRPLDNMVLEEVSKYPDGAGGALMLSIGKQVEVVGDGWTCLGPSAHRDPNTRPGTANSYGNSMMFVSDMDFDQVPDLLLSAPNGTYSTLLLLSGRTGAILREWHPRPIYAQTYHTMSGPSQLGPEGYLLLGSGGEGDWERPQDRGVAQVLRLSTGDWEHGWICPHKQKPTQSERRADCPDGNPHQYFFRVDRD